MGKKVNVVLTDGKVVTVSEEDAARLVSAHTAKPETVQHDTARAVSASNEERASGVAQGVGAFVEGAADTVTGGLYGKAASYGDPEYGADLANRGQHRPLARLAGSIAGLAVPTGLPAAAGAATKTVTKLAGSAKVGELVGGAVYGAGNYVAGTNVSGDPLSVEGLVEEMTVGGVLNVGFHVAGEKLKSIASKINKGKTAAAEATGKGAFDAEFGPAAKGKTPLADAARAREDLDQAKLDALKDTLDSSPGYAGFKDAHESVQAEAKAYNAKVKKDAAHYANEVKPGKLSKRLDQLEQQQQELRAARYSTAPSPDTEATLTRLRQDTQRARAAIKSGEVDEAADILRGHFPDVPMRAGEPVLVGPKLPETLSGLGSKQVATIADIAETTAGASKAELDKLALELGLEPAENAVDTLSAIHKHMREGYVLPGRDAVTKAEWKAASAEVDAQRAVGGGPLERVEGEVTSGGATPTPKGEKGLLAKAQSWAKRGLEYSAARAADTGGWKGAITRTMVGGAVGYGLGGVEGVLLGEGLVHGKNLIKTKIADAFAKFGPTAGRVISEMGPVTDAMRFAFPGGHDDDERDPGIQTVKRINDVLAASASAPDTMFETMRGLMGDPSDGAFKISQKVTQGLQYLAMTAPKDPGINVTPTGSDWTPSFIESNEWAHRYEAVLSPMTYLARVLSGDGHPSGVEALAFHWPAIMQESVEQAAMHDWAAATESQINGLSELFRTPMSALQHPDVQMMLQTNNMPQPEQTAQGGKQSGGANGRPPAVNSQVAGSSVGLHTNKE